MNLKRGMKETSWLFKGLYLVKMVLYIVVLKIHNITIHNETRDLKTMFNCAKEYEFDIYVLVALFLIAILIFYDYGIFWKKCKKRC